MSTIIGGTNPAVTFPDGTTQNSANNNFAGPAFSVWANASQSITGGSATKILFDTKNFDTNNNFASSRFTPTIAGYYQCSWSVPSSIVQTSRLIPMLYKNGSEALRGTDIPTNTWSSSGSGLVYCNGTTDYLEVYAYFGSSANTGNSQAVCYFTGTLVRVA